MNEINYVNGSKLRLDPFKSRQLILILPKYSDKPFPELFIKRFYKNHLTFWAIFEDYKIVNNFESICDVFLKEAKFHKEIVLKNEYTETPGLIFPSLYIKFDGIDIKYNELKLFYDNKETIDQFCRDNKNGKLKKHRQKLIENDKKEFEERISKSK